MQLPGAPETGAGADTSTSIVQQTTLASGLAHRTRDITFYEMDQFKLLGTSALCMSISRAVASPAVVLKTRMQAQRTGAAGAYLGMAHACKTILREEGVGGFYRGVAPFVFSAIPAQILHITTYEWARAQHSWPAGTEDAVAGMLAACVAQLINVPMDTITQRTMMHRVPVSPLVLARELWRTEGASSFVRGLGASLVNSAPHSALWWVMYRKLQQPLTSALGPHCSPELTTALSVSLGGVGAGLVAATLTNPLDVIRTRMLVDTTAHRPTIGSTAATLLREETLLSFWTKGLSARLVVSSAMSATYALGYELAKRLALRPSDDDLDAEPSD